MSNNATYAPSDLVVIISHEIIGNHIVGGFSANEMVTVNRSNPTWTHETSPDGFHTRTHNLDKAGSAVITLVQSSQSNDALHALAAYDEARKNDEGLFAITIADKSGRSVISSNSAYVSVPQEKSFGREIGNRTWNVTMMDCEEYIGGNGKLSKEVISMLEAAGFSVDDQWK